MKRYVGEEVGYRRDAASSSDEEPLDEVLREQHHDDAPDEAGAED